MRLGWTLASALLCSCSPFGGGAFSCATSDQCTLAGSPGICQSSGACSYADPSCAPSGQRYGAQAGGLANSCVGDEPLDGSGAPPIDISRDTLPATTDAACMIQGLDFCTPGMEPAGPLQYSDDTTINTNTISNGGSPLCRDYAQSGGPQACLIVVSSFAISAHTTVTFTGDRPLILAVSGTATISGTLDVSSHNNPGAGANGNSNCNMGATKPTDNKAGASGGAGGTFANYGGNSGVGDNGDAPNKSPASKAGSLIAPQPPFVRGGCKGLDGGKGEFIGQVAVGGGGGGGTAGGGVWLYANDIEIPTSGVIDAGGAGGAGGGQFSGGGGGGSGGYIHLFASTATIAGTLAANGGGGGEGGGMVPLSTADGGDDASADANAAQGGNKNNFGGHGGNGSTTDQAGNGQDSPVGSGAGGGGQGYIVLTIPSPMLAGSTISPPLTH